MAVGPALTKVAGTAAKMKVKILAALTILSVLIYVTVPGMS